MSANPTMRSAALATKDEYDEVRVSSNEVLEANVAAIRADLNELKGDFRAAVARLDSDIKTAVSKLETEIRAMAARAERDLRDFASRVENQIAEVRQEQREMREKFDNLDRKVTHIDSKLTALLWVVGGLGTLITLAITAGKAFQWF